MKKTLAVAALLAVAFASPVAPVFAGDMAKPTLSCFFIPLTAECKAEADAMHAAHKADVDAKMAALPKPMAPPAPPAMTAPAAPVLPAMPTCTPAAKGAGHLLDCSM